MSYRSVGVAIMQPSARLWVQSVGLTSVKCVVTHSLNTLPLVIMVTNAGQGQSHVLPAIVLHGVEQC